MLGDDVAARLPELRAQAESLMVDACTITRRGAPGVINETTGIIPPPAVTTVYSGKCRVQMPQAQNSNPTTGDVEWTVQSFVLQVPMSVVGVHIDDTVTITAAAMDPDLVGRVLKVVSLAHKTHATARRLACEEVTA